MAKELSDKSAEELKEFNNLGSILKKRDDGSAIEINNGQVYGIVGGRKVSLMPSKDYGRYRELCSKYKQSSKKNYIRKNANQLYDECDKFFRSSEEL